MPRHETRFFEDPEYLSGDISKLESLFDHLPPGKVIGIKRPDYLAKPECPERIRRHIPDAKLIVVLRDPVERAISSYFYQIRQGFIPIKPLEQGIRAIFRGEYQRAYPKSAEIIEYGFYHSHLTRYLEHFGRGQLLILLFELIKKEPLEALRQVYRFLDVDERHVPELLAKGGAVNRGVYSLTRLRLLTIANSLRFTYNENRTRRYRKCPPLLSKVFARTVDWLDAKLLTRICENSRPVLSGELKERLVDVYRDDLDRLEELLGEPLPSLKLYSAGLRAREMSDTLNPPSAPPGLASH